jgi:hypothetical protein
MTCKHSAYDSLDKALHPNTHNNVSFLLPSLRTFASPLCCEVPRVTVHKVQDCGI